MSGTPATASIAANDNKNIPERRQNVSMIAFQGMQVANSATIRPQTSPYHFMKLARKTLNPIWEFTGADLFRPRTEAVALGA